MTAKKSLQKFTETENRVIKLFEQKKIVPEDYKDFDKNEKKQFDVELQKRMNTLQGSEKRKIFGASRCDYDSRYKKPTLGAEPF